MSEKQPLSPEAARDTIDTSVESEKNFNRLREAAEKSPEFDDKNLETLKQHVDKEAVSGKEYTVGETQEGGRPQTVSRALKQDAYRKTLKRVRHHLSAPDRVLSRIIHQPVVEKASVVGSQTIGRSSGLLGGGIFAFVGSVGLLVLAKHNGFTYNYLAFLLLFILGFAVGLIIEVFVKLLVRPAKH